MLLANSQESVSERKLDTQAQISSKWRLWVQYQMTPVGKCVIKGMTAVMKLANGSRQWTSREPVNCAQVLRVLSRK
jgi:hypothetical protein